LAGRKNQDFGFYIFKSTCYENLLDLKRVLKNVKNSGCFKILKKEEADL